MLLEFSTIGAIWRVEGNHRTCSVAACGRDSSMKRPSICQYCPSYISSVGLIRTRCPDRYYRTVESASTRVNTEVEPIRESATHGASLRTHVVTKQSSFNNTVTTRVYTVPTWRQYSYLSPRKTRRHRIH